MEVSDLRWGVKNHGKFIVQEGLIVQGTDFHDNLKSNEMNDAMIDCVLVGQQNDVDTFSKERAENLNKSDHIGDFWTSINELFWVVVGKFHEFHTFGNLWIEAEMESNSTWELNVEDWEIVWEGSLFSWSDNLIDHTSKHWADNKCNDECWI